MRGLRVLLLLLAPLLLLAGPVEDADVSSDDYYSVLGLARNCDAKAVKKHYRKLAMEWHPEQGPGCRGELQEDCRSI